MIIYGLASDNTLLEVAGMWQTPLFLLVFHDWITSKQFELASLNLVWWLIMMIFSVYCSRIKIRPP